MCRRIYGPYLVEKGTSFSLLPTHLISHHLIFIYLDISSINYRDMNSRKEQSLFQLSRKFWIKFRAIHWLMFLTTWWKGHSGLLISVESMSNKDYFLYLWISANHSLERCYSAGLTPCICLFLRGQTIRFVPWDRFYERGKPKDEIICNLSLGIVIHQYH
jgi:hypothetical protein